MKTSRLLVGAAVISLSLLAGCLQGERSSVEIDPPQHAEAVSDIVSNEETEVQSHTGEGEQTSETVARQLYLIDANGFVASQVIELPFRESLEVATQVLEYLVTDGPISEVLPNGFRAVLPAGTEVLGLNLLDNGTMIVDFSEEFKDYAPQDEVKIIEAITHTLTQFENVERVQLWMNGHPLDELPVNGTPIGEGYSKEKGINLTSNDTIDFINSSAVTMYYPANYEVNRYYVPVTQYVELGEQTLYEAIIQSLMTGPGFLTNVMHVFNDEARLKAVSKLEEGVLEVEFNEAILKDSESAVIADEVIETIVRTLTALDGIEAVQIQVEDVEVIRSESGEPYDEPVSADFLMTAEQL